MGVYAYLAGEEGRSGVAKRVTIALALLSVMAVAMVVMANPAQATNLTVTSNADAGPGTLRAAVDTANGNGMADNIFFNLPSDQRTIMLTTEQIFFTDTAQTTIDGGTAGVTVSGNNASRVFRVNGGNLSVKSRR